jgi:hypothetical protein
MLKKAKEWGLIEESPFNKGGSLQLKENNKRLRFLLVDEIPKLLNECNKYLKDIQELLGHKTMTMTLRYAHLTQEHKKKAVDLLNGLTASSPSHKMSHLPKKRLHDISTKGVTL